MDKEKAHAEIMWMFRYTYRNEWAPGSIFDGKTRIWIKTFNELVEKGFIKRKKDYPSYKYRWTGVWPEKY